MKHEFASGHWIDITPVQGLKAKHKDAYEGAPKLFLKFDENGNADLSGIPVSMTMAKMQRNGLLATLIYDWSFTQDDGVTKLPVPHWDGLEIHDMESFGEIPIDDMNDLEEYLVPYLEKVQRKPDPKKTTTGSSSGPSKPEANSRKG